jgi:uncharacterized surface protein with fasciclin (FAS1) repeats
MITGRYACIQQVDRAVLAVCWREQTDATVNPNTRITVTWLFETTLGHARLGRGAPEYTCSETNSEDDMKPAIKNFSRSILSVVLCSGLGLAMLPAVSQANACMMSKPYAYKGNMAPYRVHPYSPMMGQGHHHHGHKGMQGYMGHGYPQRYGMPGKYSGTGKAKSYSDSHGSTDADQPVDAKGHAASSSSGASGLDIIETAAAAEEFSILIRAVRAAGLDDVLRGEGPFTVFAPRDAAFAKLPEGTVDALIADNDKLVAVLSYHVVPERLTAADLLQRREFTTVQGQKLSLEKLNVASADINASNGIIHIIDAVLIPEQ